jgi:amino acid transporter
MNLEPKVSRLNLFALVSVIFFTVSGGAYGLESLVGAIGPGWAVLLVMIVPILWSVPVALMVCELSSAMPEEGGYYVWVRRALGDFWGVQEGWWTICYTAVDMAIYPVLFVNYLAFFFPILALNEDTSLKVLLIRWLISILIIVTALILNLNGARAVGQSAIFNLGLVLSPFILLSVMGLSNTGSIAEIFSTLTRDVTENSGSGFLALGLATILWNYCGWDNVSTFAAEVENPQRNYPRALMIALPLIIAAYLLPILAGLSATTDPNIWNESAGWPAIAGLLGGHWFGSLIAGVALLSAWSLFNSQLLYVSRLPYAMALDGWLPKALTRTSKKTGVPTVALIASCAISAIFSALPFGKLVVIDILLYSAALILEFIALIVLRYKAPEMIRPFKISGGLPVLIVMTIAPMICSSVVVITSFSDPSTDARQAIVVILSLLTGIVLYRLRRGTVKGENIKAVTDIRT